MDIAQDGDIALDGQEKIKIAIGLPFYDGPDVHTFDEYFAHMAYYGKLQERAYLRNIVIENYGKSEWNRLHKTLPPLDSQSKTGLSELRDDDPVFSFSIIKNVKNSLIGQARETIVEEALKTQCDYVFFFDNDILFAKETLLRLYRHRKPVVYALAFTGREPVAPVLYDFVRRTDVAQQVTNIDIRWKTDYPRDTLFRVDASGSGVMLVNCDVFREIGKGWFNSQGSGEDIHFAKKCDDHHIPLFVDSSIWTAHKPNFPMFWHDQHFYDISHTIYERIKLNGLFTKS